MSITLDYRYVHISQQILSMFSKNYTIILHSCKCCLYICLLSSHECSLVIPVFHFSILENSAKPESDSLYVHIYSVSKGDSVYDSGLTPVDSHKDHYYKSFCFKTDDIIAPGHAINLFPPSPCDSWAKCRIKH